MSQAASETYSIKHWSENYFHISPSGHACVQAAQTEVRLTDIINRAQQHGMQLPILLRFPDIIKDRINTLGRAFGKAMQQEQYRAGYQAIYPIKVNQHRHVVEAVLSAQQTKVGLEAGSKPELMAIIAMSTPGKNTLVCNGYKDEEYLKLALIATAMGHEVYIIIERYNELTALLQLSSQMNITPRIGLRVRLASIAHGKWQNTGGEKSKFGLSANEVISLVETLKHHDKLTWLQLLHFHMGSQIANIRDIQKGLREGTRYFAEITQLGANIHTVDVGGGLGIDYDGSRSRNHCSINYTIDEYAHNIIQQFKEVCQQHKIDEPTIFTEAGRAMVAHHAVLVTNVIDHESNKGRNPPNKISSTAHPLLKVLLDHHLQDIIRGPIEHYHTVVDAFLELQNLFTLGQIDIQQKAQAEDLYFANLLKIKAQLNKDNRAQRELFDELNEKLAHKYFCNFSLFQSIPDVWAIQQIFPIMPLQDLDQPLTERVIIQDLTCDSDGRIDTYVDNQNIEHTLAAPKFSQEHSNLFGLFLTGAYQEILGDCHNLFGDTDSVSIYLENNDYQLRNIQFGQSRDEVLKQVHFEYKSLICHYQQQLHHSGLDQTTCKQYLSELIAGLKGNTYFATGFPDNGTPMLIEKADKKLLTQPSSSAT